jgi:hypothetical protein
LQAKCTQRKKSFDHNNNLKISEIAPYTHDEAGAERGGDDYAPLVQKTKIQAFAIQRITIAILVCACVCA